METHLLLTHVSVNNINTEHTAMHTQQCIPFSTVVELKKFCSRVHLKPDGTWWRMGGEVMGKLANGVGSQYPHTTLEHGVSSITNADAHTSAASSRLKWRPRRLKWTRPFRQKTKSGFCAYAITFQTQFNKIHFDLHVQCHTFCPISNFMKIHQVRVKPTHADKWTDRQDKAQRHSAQVG
jgi:hypothetical protein